MIEYVDVINKIKSKQLAFEYNKKLILDSHSEKTDLINKVNKSIEKKNGLEELVYTCKLILEKITYANKASLEAFLTYAIKNIFIDRDYTIELVLRDDTKRPALELTLTENGIQQEITDAVGGGIISTIGLLLQIYYIEIFNLSKIIFIDEGLKEISTGLNNESKESVNYLSCLLEFLQWMSSEKQYAFVIVTHDNNVRKFASTVYEVNLGEVIKC